MLSVYEGGPSERDLDVESMLGQTEWRRSRGFLMPDKSALLVAHAV